MRTGPRRFPDRPGRRRRAAPQNPPPADYGHASRLGPRFLDWQLQKDPAQSWLECEAHATQLESLWSHARTLAGLPTSDKPTEDTEPPQEPTARTTPKRSQPTPDNQGEFQF